MFCILTRREETTFGRLHTERFRTSNAKYAASLQLSNARENSKFEFKVQFFKEFYNSEPVGYNDKTDLLYGELNSLKESMMENLTTSMERQGKIQVSLERSESLVSTSKTYKRTARRVESSQRNKKLMLYGIAYLVVLVSSIVCINIVV